MTNLQHIIDFVIELDQLKSIQRKNKIVGQSRYENSAEHSWQIALLALALEPYAPEAIDINHVVRLLLVHDIGEIDAGDTLVFAEIDWIAEKAKEHQAVIRIFGLLPEAQQQSFIDIWQEFEDGQTREAQFANAIDRAMPALLNLANQGQSWIENGISHARVVERLAPSIQAGCPALWIHIKTQLDKAQKNGWFGA